MIKKTFALFAFSALMLTLIVGAVSAVNLNSIALISAPSGVSQDVGTFDVTFNLTNIGAAGSLNFSASTVSNGGSITFNDLSIANGSSSTPTTEVVTATVIFPKNMIVPGSVSGLINVTGTGMTTSETLPFSVTITPTTLPPEVFSCILTHDALPANFKDKLKVDIHDISVEEGFGEDNQWFPLDTVNVEVDVENNWGNDDEEIENIELGWGLYDTQTGEFIIDDEESDFDLDAGDEQRLNIQFKLDDDIDMLDSNNLVFYVWANGEDTNGINGTEDTCGYSSSNDDADDVIDMQIEDFVILDNVQVPEVVQCSEEVTLTADVWNIGNSDQEDVHIEVYSKELGLNNQRIELGDVDNFDNVPFELKFKVPSGLSEKPYSLQFSIYDEDNDLFEVSGDFDEESVFNVLITVKGNCGAAAGTAAVSATLESGGKAGEAMVVKTTVTNKGAKTAEFMINAAGYSEWASAASVSEDSFTLEPGKSKDVTITLQTKEDAKGEQTFNVEVLSGNELVTTQPVAVKVEGSASGFFSAITGNAVNDGKSLWIIGALNVLLVFAIIVIAVRFFLRK